MVDFEMQKPVLLQMQELEDEDIQIAFPDAVVSDENPLQTHRQFPSELKDIQLSVLQPIPEAQYKFGFDHVMQQLKYGNSYLTNYTGKTEIETNATLQQIFTAAEATYKIRYKDEWVCFSPECFIKIKAGEICSFPMKGTIDADLPDAAATLLADEKEIAEHFTIVDLIRNDLSMVAENVVVEKFRYLEEIHSNQKNLLQASSIIKGKLPEGYQNTLGDLLFTLLPAGSVSGAPKKKTTEIIRDSELNERAYYTGVAFYFDGQNVDSCVLIRFIEKNEGRFFYRSGGGITVNSEMEKEYQELNDKIYVPVS
jgi:para-aminobenzoate synthetase component 1